jgi:hypothetical protein
MRMVREGAKISGVRSNVQPCERLPCARSCAMEHSLFTIVNDDRHPGKHGDIAGLVDGPDAQLV